MNTFYRANLLLIAFVLFLVACTASAVTAESVSPTITETQITTSGSASDPHIYGDRIVWQDDRNGNSDIYMYDLSTKRETQITTNGSAHFPDIYGDRVVWQGDRIYMYDISTEKETQISTSGSAHYPAIYEDKIVWGDYSGGSDIYMYDLSTEKETKISTSGFAEMPDIYGNKIVWGDASGTEIYIYDLDTMLDIGAGGYARIYGDKLVWDDGRQDNPDADPISNIHMYDLSTEKETQITTSGSASSPESHGDRIVYTDARNGDDNIYVYDLAARREAQITTSGSAVAPAIYGDRIVWEESRNGNNDIYMATITWTEEPPVDDNNTDDSNETQVTISGSAYNPAIYGDRLVWEDYRSGNADIYMYDRTTEKETQITSSPDAQTHPAIYGNRVVWQDDGGEDDGWVNHGIFMYDISTNKKMRISPTELAYDPAIYGNRIVYSSTRNGNTDVYMYDLSTSKEAQITSSPDAQTNPVIYENRVVWQDDGGEDDGYINHGIFMHDISTSKKMRISPTELAYEPAIYGNRIVYSSTRDGNTDVYIYDLSTSRETQITSSPDKQAAPAIYENRIVWQDDGGEDDGWVNHGIFMYDISTNQKMKISPAELAYQPAIYDNRIVYASTRNGESDIYIRTI
ncbi:hypothetical protein [Methanosarcina sp. MSH10X1]|uniref:hypothetical protein n=1 Tax=Methanosarcina sp. MSH10X1 TaxID=2507075 RepID=UPI001F0C9DF7|nr:hypothetical protein [Methanosarcina sp. MSH10X1]